MSDSLPLSLEEHEIFLEGYDDFLMHYTVEYPRINPYADRLSDVGESSLAFLMQCDSALSVEHLSLLLLVDRATAGRIKVNTVDLRVSANFQGCLLLDVEFVPATPVGSEDESEGTRKRTKKTTKEAIISFRSSLEHMAGEINKFEGVTCSLLDEKKGDYSRIRLVISVFAVPYFKALLGMLNRPNVPDSSEPSPGLTIEEMSVPV